MNEVGYLVDTSALTRLLRDPALRKAWRREVAAGALACLPDHRTGDHDLGAVEGGWASDPVPAR